MDNKTAPVYKDKKRRPRCKKKKEKLTKINQKFQNKKYVG